MPSTPVRPRRTWASTARRVSPRTAASTPSRKPTINRSEAADLSTGQTASPAATNNTPSNQRARHRDESPTEEFIDTSYHAG